MSLLQRDWQLSFLVFPLAPSPPPPKHILVAAAPTNPDKEAAASTTSVKIVTRIWWPLLRGEGGKGREAKAGRAGADR